MTKPAGTPRKRPEPRQRKLDARAAQDLGRLTSLTLSPPTLRSEIDAAASSTWPTPPESTPTTKTSDSAPLRSFYLGSTSYASVFAEDGPLPNSMHQQPSERMSMTPSSVSSRNMGTRHCQMAIGHSVISRLSPFSFYEKAVLNYFDTSIGSGYMCSLVKTLLAPLRQDLERISAPGADVGQMYADITKNTAKPMKVPSNMLPSEWHTLLTGRNLRWETIGLILSIATSTAQYTNPKDPIFMLADGSTLAKDEYIEDMLQATNDCITLCQVHGAVNDVMVWLLLGNMNVVSSAYGDNCAYPPHNHRDILMLVRSWHLEADRRSHISSIRHGYALRIRHRRVRASIPSRDAKKDARYNISLRQSTCSLFRKTTHDDVEI